MRHNHIRLNRSNIAHVKNCDAQILLRMVMRAQIQSAKRVVAIDNNCTGFGRVVLVTTREICPLLDLRSKEICKARVRSATRFFTDTSTICRCNPARTMESPIEENEQTRILDHHQETSRTAPEANNDLVRELLAEVSDIRKENQQLRSEVANLKTKTKRQLFQRSKDNDPECSVSKIISCMSYI